MTAEPIIRDAVAEDLSPLAQLWHQGWWDAHATIVPESLARLRTLESFTARLAAALHKVRTVGPVGAPLGFHLIKGDELYQFYVARVARGTGTARFLMRDAERALLAAGVTKPWLACAIGNDRAARFYEKSGWTRAATVRILVETSEGPYPLDVWRYEKILS